MDKEQEEYTPTAEDEAIYTSMLTSQVVSAIQNEYTNGKLADLDTYNRLYAIAKKADIQVRKLADLLGKGK